MSTKNVCILSRMIIYLYLSLLDSRVYDVKLAACQLKLSLPHSDPESSRLLPQSTIESIFQSAEPFALTTSMKKGTKCPSFTLFFLPGANLYSSLLS